MRESWELKKLDTLIIENPKSKFKVRDSFDKGDYIFFTSGIKTKKMNTFLIDGENIFLSTGGQAIVSYYNGKASYSTDAYSIKGNPINLNTKFLYYFILLNLDKIDKNMFKGAALKHLQKKDFKNLSISTPSMQQQKEIVEILDQTFESIDKAKANIEKNIENAKELFQSKINQIFSQTGGDWEENEFGDVITTLTDYHANGSYKILKKNVVLKDKEDYAWMIRSTDFEKKFKNQFKYIDKHAYNFLSKSKVFGNELIMSKIGNAGKIYLMPKVDRPVSLAMNLFLIRLDEKRVLSEFVFQFLQSKIGKIQIKERVKGTTTKTITKNNVRNIIVLYPPITKQKEIVETLNIMDNHIQSVLLVYEEELKNLEELKKSILQKAFSGELTNKNKAA